MYVCMHIYLYIFTWWVGGSSRQYIYTSKAESIILSGITVNFTTSVLPEFSFSLIK